MAEETTNTMNLDLNLGPIDHSSENDTVAAGSGTIPDESMNLEDWLESPVNRFREVVRHRRRWRSVWRHIPMPPEARDMALELIGGGSGLQPGEGSIAPEERIDRPAIDLGKVCETNNGFLKEDILGKKDDDEKGSGDAGCFFDCNICLDLSKDPVVTCCGHLFCWSCLYRWLHVHSDAKECPVCKGEVTTKNLTPIYGRGKNAPRNLEEEDFSLKIPLRPQAHRVESLRQVIQRTALNLPMEEMIRLLNGRFDLSQVHNHNVGVDAPPPRESPERTTSFLNRFLSSRGIRREAPNNILSVSPDDVVVDLSHPNGTINPELVGESQSQSRRISSLFLSRSNSSQAATISHLTSALSSAERLVESYFRSSNPLPPVSAERDHHHRQEQQQTLPPDDRDSISSIAAVIHSESQTVDTAVEIDSTVSRSTSSSRRRQQDSSRISDVDSGDSRAPRRRRLG